jgi:formate-dependent nitrite reductase membrane component NrfD
MSGTPASQASERDTTPAVGTPGEPGRYRRAFLGARVALHRRRFRDAAWSFLYGRGSRYAAPRDGDDRTEVRDAGRRARTGPYDGPVQGPVVRPAVWTWEIPAYFWLGGVASGSAFVALACDLSGDERSARVARGVSLAALVPCPLLLISDLGRPARFLNMLRIVKVRSPMSTGAWCLTVFGNLLGAAVTADLLGRHRAARALGAASAVAGGYVGAYTGVLLASTAIPVWSRSRLFLGPIFVSTATATGAAATRLVLAATGTGPGHPTRIALGRVEVGAIAAELALSAINERRLGQLAGALRRGRAGRLLRLAKTAVLAGLALRALPEVHPAQRQLDGVLYLAGGLAFRYAWVAAGRASAADDEAVARTARSRDVK